MELTAPTANAGERPYNSYYNGVLASVRGDTGDGGTAGDQKGDLYGLSAQVTLSRDARYWAGIQGGEWGIDVFPGASVANKIGLQIALGSHDAVAGTNLDDAILLSNNSRRRDRVFGRSPRPGPCSVRIIRVRPRMGSTFIWSRFRDARSNPGIYASTAMATSPFRKVTDPGSPAPGWAQAARAI